MLARLFARRPSTPVKKFAFSRLGCELLEGREVPATFTVNSVAAYPWWKPGTHRPSSSG